MCSPVPCTCGKTTWAGCGRHVDDVRQLVPAAQWCDGDRGRHWAPADPEPTCTRTPDHRPEENHPCAVLSHAGVRQDDVGRLRPAHRPGDARVRAAGVARGTRRSPASSRACSSDEGRHMSTPLRPRKHGHEGSRTSTAAVARGASECGPRELAAPPRRPCRLNPTDPRTLRDACMRAVKPDVIHAQADPYLLDVREPAEVEQARIDGAHLIALGELAEPRRRSPHRPDYLFITGGRCAPSSPSKESGLDVVNVAGGITEWYRLGLPVTLGATR